MLTWLQFSKVRSGGDTSPCGYPGTRLPHQAVLGEILGQKNVSARIELLHGQRTHLDRDRQAIATAVTPLIRNLSILIIALPLHGAAD
jgi:hypothetical protein